MDFSIRDAAEADLPRILEITNQAIAQTTAIWSFEPETPEARRAWFAQRRARDFPVLVAADGTGGVLGYGSFGEFRPRDGYRNTVEHSVYVDAAQRRRGLGRALLEALIERAQGLSLHAMVGGIEAGNEASIRLHRQLGFVETGRLPQVGHKFGRWLDLVFMQRMLDT
jgi:L-amino acid N-acyltransferase YncA